MGELFAAGYEALNRYRDAKDRSPAGFAVVTAAIEWRRAGMLRPIEQPILHRLASRCLSAMRTTSPMTTARFDEALAWACQPPVPL
jgi:hypothetical protein